MKWETRTLGDVVTLINGRAYSQHELLSKGTPVIRIQNLNGGSNWYYSNLELPDDKYCHEGDLLFAWSASFGPYVWNGPKAIYHYHIWKVVPKNGVHGDFMFHLLQWITESVRLSSHGIGMLHMTKEGMEKWIVSIPALAEQKRLALRLREQLAEVEKAREALQAQLEAAEKIHAAALRAAFAESVQTSWPKSRLGDVANITAGVTLGRKLAPGSLRKVPYLRVANVKDGRLDLSHVTATEAKQTEIDHLRLRFGDLLLTEGGDPDKLGRGTFWRDELPECIHQNHVFRLRFDLAKFDPAFLAFQFGSEYGKAYFFAHAKQTTGIATINRKVLDQFPLLCPTLAIQQATAGKLTESLAGTHSLIAEIRARLEAVEKLPGALLREVFTTSP